jgi:DNA-binding CsgD family transcriptional regulator/PAS domain-containing protein
VLSATSVDSVISAVYGAASAKNPWEYALDGIADIFGLWGSQLLGLDKRQGSIICTHEGGPATAQARLAYVREHHELNPRVRPSLTIGLDEWMHDHHHFDERFMGGHPFYRDFLAPFGGRYMSATKLIEDDRHVVMFAAMRGHGDVPLGPDEIDAMDRIKRHMVEALRIQDHLRQTTPTTGIAGPILDQFTQPVMLIDEERRIVFRNAAAAHCLGGSGPLVEQRGVLATMNRADNYALVLKLKSLELSSMDRRARPTRALVPLRGESHLPVLLFLQAIRPARTMYAFGHRALALVIVYDPSLTRGFDPQIVREAFGMTPAEARVAIGLAQGHSAADLADSYRVSVHTLRSQVQSVMRKPGTGRQADVVRILSGLPMVGGEGGSDACGHRRLVAAKSARLR